jgi:hypothetical protein
MDYHISRFCTVHNDTALVGLLLLMASHRGFLKYFDAFGGILGILGKL